MTDTANTRPAPSAHGHAVPETASGVARLLTLEAEAVVDDFIQLAEWMRDRVAPSADRP